MKKILILVILSLLTALFAVSAPSVSAENDPETACNGFLPIKGSAVVLSPKDDGGVSVTANKTGDGFIFEKPVTGDRIDLYINLSCLNVRISVIFADANGNAGDWYYIQEYWGGVNVQGYGYWSDPGDDNPVGYQHFGFLLTESGTEFYYNGKYIYKSSVKKSFYGQGVSLVFGFEKDADFSADLRVGQPSLTETDRNSVIPSGEDVFFPADFNHAKVRSVVLEKDGVPITLQEEQFSVGQDGVTVRGDFIKTLSAGNYSVRIVTAAGDLIGTLHLSDDWKAEINDSTELVFDKHKGGDLTVYYFANGDKAVGVAGERITENDFVCNGDESSVTIRENYLKTLPSGISAFKLITEKAAEGISFLVTVLNSAPPLCAENEKTYDIYSPSDVVFTAEIHENELLSVSGDPVGIRDVTVENGGIKIRRTAFDGLTPGDKVTFTLRFTYGDLILSVKVVSSEKCVIYEKNKRVNKSGPISLYFSADMKYDEIVSIEGNGIEDGDYSFDPARNAIVLGKEYLSRLTQTGDYSFTVRTANGLTDVIVVSVFDALPPETADAEVKAYDKSAGGSLSFRVKANGSGLISVNGKSPDSGNYSVRSDGDDFTLTLSESFLRDLQNGPATVTAVFTGGEIEFRLEISNSLASHFETGNDVLYDVRGEGDYTVNVQTNYGRMIGVNGNGISPDDYVFNHAAGTLTISGKFLSCGSRTEPYSILLDNGELTLVLSDPLKESPTDLYVPMYTYMEPENSVVLSGSDGWAEVRYAKPKTADFAGGVKFRYLFDVSRPVTVYVDFLSVPALAGSSFVFTLSSEDYKMYYDNGYGKSELFGVFAVGNTYLQTAYFGVQPEDGIPEAQISHELLKRSDKGYETFTFDIGNASSKIYFNGTLIRETDRVTRSSFKDGKIYLLFTPHFWQEKEGAAFRIRTEAEPLSYTSGLILNTLTKKDVNIRLNTRNSVITGVYLDTDEGETPIGGCALTHDPVTGEAVLTIPADAILYSRGYDGNPKSVTVRTDGGSISVPLSISSSKEAEFYSYGEVFDLNEGSDVSFFYESNLDEIVRLEGANLTGNDYTIQNGLLTIRKDYLLSLETGIKTFRVVTSLDPDGKILSVNVVRSDPPEAENAEGTFDLYGGTDMKFRVRINENHSLVLYGNGVDEGCYAYSSENEVLTVKADYLNRLNVGEYVLWIRAYYTEFLYKEIPLKINVRNSLSPVFENGSATCEETYVSGSGKPLSLKVNANNGKLIDVAGGYIGADSFRYDATTGVFVFSGRWMETLDEGRTKIRIRFDNGTLTFTINVKENEDASEPDSGTTKKGCRGAADGCALLSVLSLACGISIKKRRKSER